VAALRSDEFEVIIHHSCEDTDAGRHPHDPLISETNPFTLSYDDHLAGELLKKYIGESLYTEIWRKNVNDLDT